MYFSPILHVGNKAVEKLRWLELFKIKSELFIVHICPNHYAVQHLNEAMFYTQAQKTPVIKDRLKPKP